MDRDQRRQMVRSIEVVEDLDASDAALRFRSVGSLLDPLSSPALSSFRREVRRRQREKAPRLLCAKCKEPVYVSLAGAGSPEGRDGRDAFFGHHAGKSESCEWGTVGESLRDIDRRKFGGAAESAWHERLKLMLAGMLRMDPAFSDVKTEEVISRPPLWRKPDVLATFSGGIVAFDLQLATTHLPTIDAREHFYEDNKIRYAWVTSSNDAHNLALQAFQDIYWNNVGQILGVDKQAEAQTRKSGELHLWVLAVVPTLDESGLRSIWERRLLSRSAIDWNTPSLRPKFQGADFHQRLRELIDAHFKDARFRLVDAVGRSETLAWRDAKEAWNEIASVAGGPAWDEMDSDRVFKAIGVLSTAAAGKKMDSSSYGEEQLTAIFNQFLETRPCRGWTSTLQGIAAAHGHSALLAAPTTQQKMKRNLEEEHLDLQRKYAVMLDVLFPRSALARLPGPPAEISTV